MRSSGCWPSCTGPGPRPGRRFRGALFGRAGRAALEEACERWASGRYAERARPAAAHGRDLAVRSGPTGPWRHGWPGARADGGHACASRMRACVTVTPEGLMLIDWDTVLLAPPERGAVGPGRAETLVGAGPLCGGHRYPDRPGRPGAVPPVVRPGSKIGCYLLAVPGPARRECRHGAVVACPPALPAARVPAGPVADHRPLRLPMRGRACPLGARHSARDLSGQDASRPYPLVGKGTGWLYDLSGIPVPGGRLAAGDGSGWRFRSLQTPAASGSNQRGFRSTP